MPNKIGHFLSLWDSRAHRWISKGTEAGRDMTEVGEVEENPVSSMLLGKQCDKQLFYITFSKMDLPAVIRK